MLKQIDLEKLNLSSAYNNFTYLHIFPFVYKIPQCEHDFRFLFICCHNF